MNAKAKRMISGITFAGLESDLVGAAPPALLEARFACALAASRLPENLRPRELEDAERALDQANLEFEAHGDTVVMRDFTSAALLKVDLAEAIGRTEAERGAAPSM